MEEKEKYSIEDFVYWLQKYEQDSYEKKYTNLQIIRKIAEAILNFIDE